MVSETQAINSVADVVKKEVANKSSFYQSFRERINYHFSLSDTASTLAFELYWEIALISSDYLSSLNNSESPDDLVKQLSDTYKTISKDYKLHQSLQKGLLQYQLDQFYQVETDDFEAKRKQAYKDTDQQLLNAKIDYEQSQIDAKLAKLKNQINRLALALNSSTIIDSEGTLQKENLDELKAENARNDKITNISNLTGYLVAAGEASVAAFGVAALGLTGPWSIPILSLVFVSAYVCNKILLSTYTNAVLHAFFDSQEIEGESVSRIFVDKKGQKISQTKINLIYSCFIFAAAAGVLYSVLSGVSIVTLLMSFGTPFGWAIAIAALPVIFTKLGITALFFKGIAEYIANFDFDELTKSVGQFFWPQYLRNHFENNTWKASDIAWYCADLIFRTALKSANLLLNITVIAGVSILFFGKLNALSHSVFGDSKVIDYIGCALTGLNTVFSFIFGLQQVEQSLSGITLCGVLTFFTRLVLVLPIVASCLVGTLLRIAAGIVVSPIMIRIDPWQEAPKCLVSAYENAYSFWRFRGAPGHSYAPNKLERDSSETKIKIDARKYNLTSSDISEFKQALSRLNSSNSIKDSYSFWRTLAKFSMASTTMPNGSGQAFLAVSSAHRKICQILDFSVSDNVIKFMLFISEFCYSSVPNYQAVIEYYEDGKVQLMDLEIEKNSISIAEVSEEQIRNVIEIN